MNCDIKIIKLKQVLAPGVYPKRIHNVRYFYHRLDGCYYMYDEKGCEFNLTTDGNIVPIDRELIVGIESLSDDTLIPIGLRADYTNGNIDCKCKPTYIKAWTYIKDLKDYLETGAITREYYRVTLTPAPYEGGVVGCSGDSIVPDEDGDIFKFKFESGSKVQLYANANAGYKFMGWKEYHTNEIISINPNWTFTIKKDMDLMAVFAVDGGVPVEQFNITAMPNDNALGSTIGGGTYNKDATCTVTATPNADCNFVEWTENGVSVSKLQSYTFTVTKARNLVAVFERKTITRYTVDTSVSPAGAGSTNGQGQYNAGASCTMRATANTGYTFKEWRTNTGQPLSTDNPYTFIVNKNQSLVAVFEVPVKPTYNIAVSINPAAGGSVTGGGSFEEGESCTVTATAATDYVFVNWTEGGNEVSKSASYTFEVTKNRTLVANFVVKAPDKFTVTTTSTPAAGGTVSGGGQYDDGTECTITVATNAGYQLDQVLVDGAPIVLTGNSYTFTVTKDVEVEAQFSLIPPTEYDITIKTEDAGTTQGTVSFGDDAGTKLGTITKKYTEGSKVTIIAEPVATYNFAGWFKDNINVSNNTSFEITVDANATYEARFTKDAYLNINVGSLAFDAAGGTKSIEITSNVSWTIE